MKKPQKKKVEIWGDDDSRIEVVGLYTPEIRGKRDRFGAPLEPDSESHFEVLDAVDHLGNSRFLSETEIFTALDALWETYREE